MAVFGWIALILLAMLGIFVIGLYLGPVIIAKVKSFGYNIKKKVEDEKLDTDKRSEERKNRDAIKRQRDFELANKKLDVKLNKVDKKIKLQTEKLELAEKLKKQTEVEKAELIKEEPKVEEPKVEETLSIELEESIEE